jgi:hypothetical protein
MVLDAQESNPFLDRLAAMTPDEWASIGSASAAWDAAWERALAAGALDLALPAMAVARASGASLGRAALAGAAAAALELEDLLRPEDFEALYAPFAPIVVRAERRLPAWGRTGAA